MERQIIATKNQIIDGAGINPNSKAIAKCVHQEELEVMEFPLGGFVVEKYFIFSDFKL